MPKTRNLFKDFKVEVAQGMRKCHASGKHKINKGDLHLAVYSDGGMRQNICGACFAPMVSVATEHWLEVVEKIN